MTVRSVAVSKVGGTMCHGPKSRRHEVLRDYQSPGLKVGGINSRGTKCPGLTVAVRSVAGRKVVEPHTLYKTNTSQTLSLLSATPITQCP